MDERPSEADGAGNAWNDCTAFATSGNQNQERNEGLHVDYVTIPADAHPAAPAAPATTVRSPRTVSARPMPVDGTVTAAPHFWQ
jgi:hypothetical protein